jgi:hypothetical protein
MISRRPRYAPRAPCRVKAPATVPIADGGFPDVQADPQVNTLLARPIDHHNCTAHSPASEREDRQESISGRIDFSSLVAM